MLSKDFLPIPRISGVKEMYSHSHSFTMISLDENAGCRGRYTVIRVLTIGMARCIGRELPLKYAREVAMRPATEDGQPLKRALKALKGALT